MKFIYSLTIALAITIGFFSCDPPKEEESINPEYLTSIKTWRTDRAERLKSDNGWLNLAGLFWLEPGESTFGADSANTVVFPGEATADFIGSFILNGDSVQMKVLPDATVIADSLQATDITIYVANGESNPLLSHETLRWFVIQRGDRIGIRLRDLNSSLVRDFEGIDNYPTDENYNVKAKFQSYNPPKLVEIDNIIGLTSVDTVYGALVFELDGQEYQLDPLGKSDGMFLMFADATSALETYGGGRYLYPPAPDENGIVALDFNKAYNPPCAFTDFATCPLPPKQNLLPIAIRAGEKNFKASH